MKNGSVGERLAGPVADRVRQWPEWKREANLCELAKMFGVTNQAIAAAFRYSNKNDELPTYEKVSARRWRIDDD